MTLFEAGAVALMAVWWLLTALRQVVDRPSLWRWDVFCLIPKWTFFSPNPIRSDLVLLTRDVETGGVPAAPWEPSPFVRRGDLTELLLNPRSRCQRVVYQVTMAALEERRSAEAKGADGRFQRALALAIRSLRDGRTDRAVEAVVLRSFGFVSDQPPRVVWTWKSESTER